jgi:hypothetical protein
MINKKKSKNWYVALTHFLTAGIFFPLAFTLFIIAIFDFVSRIEPSPITLFVYLISVPPTILGLWLGNLVAVKYINKKYMVKNKNIILKYSVIYFIMYNLLFFGANVKFNIALMILITIVEIFIYYFISKKYIAKII